MSLVELYPEEFQRIAKQAPAIAEMARHFKDPRAMSVALGYEGSTVHHWIGGRNGISSKSDRLAREWLLKNQERQDEPEAEVDMILVAIPSGKYQKVSKVLSLLGCDVTEI